MAELESDLQKYLNQSGYEELSTRESLNKEQTAESVEQTAHFNKPSSKIDGRLQEVKH